VAFYKDLEKKYPNLIKVNTIGKTWEDREIIEVTITKEQVAHWSRFFRG
jgi:hypothetical protein